MGQARRRAAEPHRRPRWAVAAERRQSLQGERKQSKGIPCPLFCREHEVPVKESEIPYLGTERLSMSPAGFSSPETSFQKLDTVEMTL